jgi:hypothetical protein
MTSSNTIRWGGLAAMLGGVFWVVWSLLGRVSFEAAGSPFADGCFSSPHCSRWPEWWGFMPYKEPTTGA